MAEPVGGTISQELRRVFEGAGITQPELAQKLGVSQSTVSDWARGARMPPVRAIALIEELAGVPKGTVLRRAGYIDDVGSTVEDAINADPSLTSHYREQMLSFYRYLRTQSASEMSSLRK